MMCPGAQGVEEIFEVLSAFVEPGRGVGLTLRNQYEIIKTNESFLRAPFIHRRPTCILDLAFKRRVRFFHAEPPRVNGRTSPVGVGRAQKRSQASISSRRFSNSFVRR